MQILAIGAHPADVFDLSGGTLANFADSGHKVYVTVPSHGSYSHVQVLAANKAAVSLSETIAIKKHECDEAARCIGVTQVRYFELDDEPFIPLRRDILALAEYVREVRPDIVITHHPKEYGHPDHPVVGDMSLRALKAAERCLEGSSREPHPMKRVYFFGSQFRGICAKLGSVPLPADFVVDISRSIDKKRKALAAFGSQSFKGSQYDEEWIKERTDKIEGHWGFMSGVKYAEEFISLTPQLVGLLP